MEIYVLVLISLFFVSIFYLKLAKKLNILDKPNERSSHKQVTVRGGGIVFAISILLFFLLNDFQYPYFFAGVMIISIVSFFDDIITLSSKIRFPFQLLAIFLILLQVGLPFHPIYLFGIALISGVGVINMFNFMDGVNGITGLYSLTSLFGLYLVNLNENIVNSDLIIYVALSLLVFGVYNFRKKALFFAGDIGSITIGVLIFFIGLSLTINLSSPIIILLIMVYGADAGNTLLYRKIFTRESIFDAHRHHIYQKLVDVYKMSHLKVSIIYGVLQLLFNVVVFKAYKLDIVIQLIIVFSLSMFLIICYALLFKLIKNKELSNNNAS
tara:strand:+ start:22647 stop:23624 length:978 start_codon:yes stop_codon:yes gene_type:complete